MNIVKINHSASGTWHRDCELISIAPKLENFEFEFVKDSDSQKWKVSFTNPVSYKVTSEEFVSIEVLNNRPTNGSIFEIKDSEIVKEFIHDHQSLNLKHYIFCFYDEEIEVVAEDVNFNHCVAAVG
jgi:hypothetical protein